MSSVNDIRTAFLEYYGANGHEIVSSSPLVPQNDPTLMFTNAGMVQFKNLFTGLETRDYNRAVTSQKCVRAGGKHNDLENVGYTARHHTFFEMLGNFSFGDYFKENAIELAWNLVTREFGLNKDKLLVTVYHEDDEAADHWKKIAGLTDDRIIRIATSDNFWAMGDTGPCGPCSEIFYDHGDHIPGGPPGSPNEDGDRFIEIWNLVFMQFEQLPDERINLPKPGFWQIDTLVGELLELHEDKVPDLDEPVAIFIRRTWRTTRNVITVVIENLGTGTAGPGIAHRPEIIRSGDANDPVVGEPGNLLPMIGRLVILVIDGDKQLVLVQAEFPGHKVPGQLDGVFLEIVAEREIAEHFKKGVVPRSIADILKVVMLATGADTFLRGYGAVVVAGLKAGEQVLELHHTGVGEHQCRVILRNQRAGGHDFVTIGTVIFKKSRSDVVYAAHHSVLRSTVIRDRAQSRCLANGSREAAMRPERPLRGPMFTRHTSRMSSQTCRFQVIRPGSQKKPHRQCRQGLFTFAGKNPPAEFRPVPANQPSSGTIGSSGESGTAASGDSAIDWSSIWSPTRPAFCRIAVSISSASSLFSRRKFFAFSRPCPIRWPL